MDYTAPSQHFTKSSRGGRGSGRGNGRGDGRGGRGGRDGNGGGNSSYHKHPKDKLSEPQEEMKRQCEIMYSIVRPVDQNNIFKYMSDGNQIVNMSPEMAYCINGTVYRKRFYDPGPKTGKKEKCVININNYSAIKTARILRSKNCDNICIMNFASPIKPGGGYDQGQLSQESSIVSQTLLFGSLLSRTALPFYDSNSKPSKPNSYHPNKSKFSHSLTKRKNDSDSDSQSSSGPSHKSNSPHAKKYNPHQKPSKSTFSLEDNGLIYSPRVPVIADGEAGTSAIPNANSGKKRSGSNFTMFDKEDVFCVDVISVSPVNKNQAIRNHNSKDIQKKINQLMETKIRNVIYMAAMRAEYLVLGAFGCGSFGNDPIDISRIFRKVLVKEHYADYFKGIEFAIGGNKPCYNAFSETFDINKSHPSDNDDDDDDDDDGHGKHKKNQNVHDYSNDDDDDNDNNNNDNYNNSEEEEEESSKPKKKSKSRKSSKHKDQDDDSDEKNNENQDD